MRALTYRGPHSTRRHARIPSRFSPLPSDRMQTTPRASHAHASLGRTAVARAEAADCEKKVKYRHLLVLRAQAARARDAALASNTPSSQGTSVASSAEDSSGDDLSA